MKQLTMCVDMGASETKYNIDELVLHQALSNNMVLRSEPSATNKFSNERLENFEMCVTTEDDKTGTPIEPLLGKYVSFGSYATRGLDVSTKPSIDDKKCTQSLNYASVLAVIAYEVERGNLWGEIKVALAVPPIELTQAQKKFEALIGKYKVLLVGGGRIPEFEAEFEITGVTCYSEPMLTSTAFLFAKRGLKHPELMKKTLLLFDIGASTTDVGIVQNGVYIERTQKTIRIGGNMIRDMLKDAIYEEHEVLLAREALEEAVKCGYIELCGEKVSIVDLLDQTREHCALRIREAMATYFKDAEIDAKTLSALVFSGGGSLSAKAEDDDADIHDEHSVGTYIAAQFGKLPVYTYGEDARFANVDGLVLHELMASKK